MTTGKDHGKLFRFVRMAVVLVVSVAVAVVLVVFRPKAERRVPEKLGRLVEAVEVRSQTATMYLDAYGTLTPRSRLPLIAEVNGKITRLHPDFKEGNALSAGDVLAVIDPRPYALEVQRRRVQREQAEVELARLDQEEINLAASIRIAEEDVTLAETEYQRLKTLSRGSVISQTTLDKAEQALLASRNRLQTLTNQAALIPSTRRQVKAQLRMAEVMLQQAAIDLENTRITTPFDCWVLEKHVETGQLAARGTMIGSIYRQGELDVTIRIPLDDVRWLPRLNGDGPIDARADVIVNHHGTPAVYPGRLVRTKASMEEKTRTLPLVVELDPGVDGASPPDASGHLQRLRPGMFVHIRLHGRAIQSVFVLARHAVHAGDVVYVADADRLKIVNVRVARRYQDTIYVTDGLSDGDRVVTTPLAGATAGMKLRVNVVSSPRDTHSPKPLKEHSPA